MLNSLLILLLVSNTATKTSSMLKYSIRDNSSIVLSGSSNLNDFQCVVNSNSTSGLLSISHDDKTSNINFKNALLRIKVASFDCKNPLMSRDLQKALKSDKFPNIEAELISAKPLGDSKASYKGSLKTTVAITISGKCKIVEIEVDWNKVKENEYRFTGSRQFLMSDFEINAPVAALGFIRVNNEIIIHFDFTIRTTPSINDFPSVTEQQGIL